MGSSVLTCGDSQQLLRVGPAQEGQVSVTQGWRARRVPAQWGMGVFPAAALPEHRPGRAQEAPGGDGDHTRARWLAEETAGTARTPHRAGLSVSRVPAGGESTRGP